MEKQDKGFLASQVDALKEAVKSLNAEVDFDIVYGAERTAHEIPLWSFIILFPEGAMFAAYSALSGSEMKAYIMGFTSAMKLFAGTYSFKPLNEEARRKPRRPLLAAKAAQQKVRQIRSAATIARFAAFKQRFRQ